MIHLLSDNRGMRLRLALPLIVACSLAACGDSSGSSSDDGDDVTPPPPPPPPATVTLTLDGAVTDEPIANAVVTATVGDQTFTATADANGNYTLQIEVEESAAGGFVTLVAEGVDQQAFVAFTSLVGTLESLAEQAGDDGTLSAEENFSTQITNVSTAEAALLQEANGGEPITSEEELEDLGSEVNGQAVLDLATAIKLAVDQAEDYPLPEGKTILDIATDPEAWPEFVADTYNQDPEAFDSAQAAIVDDPDLTQPILADDVPQNVTAAVLSTRENFTFNLSERVASYIFNDDGTGTVAGGSFSRAMTWTVADNDIVVTYSTPVETFGYPSTVCDGLFRQVYSSFVSEGVTLTMLSERTVAITETAEITYLDCPSLEPTVSTTTAARTIVTDTDFQPIFADEVADVAQTIYVYDPTQPTDPIVADIADISADGTGMTRLLGKTFTWELDDAGLMVTATFGDGTVARYRVLRDFDELGSDMFYEIETATKRYAGADLSAHLDPELPLEFTATNVPGSYYQFGVGEESDPDPRLKGFRLRFDDGGVGAQVYDYIDESGELVVVDENVEPVAFRWTIEADGLYVRRTWANCNYTEPGCLLGDVRQLIGLGSFELAGGSRVYVLEKRRVDWDGGVTAATPATYLIRFYDTEEAAETAGSGKPMAGHSALISRDPGRELR